MQKVSAIILTHNNEDTIEKAIKSVLWCDEIIILDDFSHDQTVSKSKSLKTKIHQRKLADNFAEQRNIALTLAENEWVFFLDSDEIVSSELAREIKLVLEKTSKNGFFIPRKDRIWGEVMKYGEFAHFSLLRLGKKNAGKWTGAVHEIWDIQTSLGNLNEPIVHAPFHTIKEFLAKINIYSTIRALELQKNGKTASFFSIIAYPFGKLIINYVIKLGLLDGVAGMVHALAMSFYSFLVQAKLWVLWHEENNRKKQTT